MFRKSAGRSSLGMIFNVDSHGDLRFCSKRRRYTVMTQLPASRGTTLYGGMASLRMAGSLACTCAQTPPTV